MKGLVRTAGLLGLAAALVLSPTSALAAESHGGWTFAIEGFYIIDFVIFIGLLVWLVKGPARKFIRARYERVTAEMESASRLKAEADAKLAEVEALFTSLDKDMLAIREQFKADGEREKARIIAETEAQAEKMRAAVLKQLEQESAALKQTLTHELIAAVLAATEAKVRQKVDQATHKALAGNYIDNLEKLDTLASLDNAA